MKRNRYKIFLTKKLELKIVSISSITELQYYSFIKIQKEKHQFTQFLFTSKLFITLLIRLLKNKDLKISDMSFYDDEDVEIKKRVLSVFENYSLDNINEKEVHNQLNYLEDDYSIDISSVNITSKDGHGELKLYVNGIFEDRDTFWNKVLIDNLNAVWNK